MQLKNLTIEFAKFLDSKLEFMSGYDEDILAYALPLDPDRAIAISEYGGTNFMDFATYNYRNIQITVRSKSVNECYDICNNIIYYLQENEGWIDLESQRSKVSILTSPRDAYIDKNNRHNFTINIRIGYNYNI